SGRCRQVAGATGLGEMPAGCRRYGTRGDAGRLPALQDSGRCRQVAGATGLGEMPAGCRRYGTRGDAGRLPALRGV
ncbi:MAG: hypothetical protein KJ686_11520, partial [Actinobacteria bacterium]|nr:hypothetical protein [Actinomycetota bacterium]